MNIPRHNNFVITLPRGILPEWLGKLHTEILKDANLLKVYGGDPVNCIIESMTGIALPGTHLQLVEQQTKDLLHTGSVTRYWPKGVNSMKMLDDNEMALTFRHIDGFHNYFMLRDAINYMADDNAQLVNNDTYKTIGDVFLRIQLTKNWQLVNIFEQVVYSSIDAVDFNYADIAKEDTFVVRMKFTYYYCEYYYKGKCISKTVYNHGAR